MTEIEHPKVSPFIPQFNYVFSLSFTTNERKRQNIANSVKSTILLMTFKAGCMETTQPNATPELRGFKPKA